LATAARITIAAGDERRQAAVTAWRVIALLLGAIALAGCGSAAATSSRAAPAHAPAKQSPGPSSSAAQESKPEGSSESAESEEEGEEGEQRGEGDQVSPEGKETAGSPSHTEDARFCSSHRCIAGFDSGQGNVVQCKDGEWSHSGGLEGVCAHDGGER